MGKQDTDFSAYNIIGSGTSIVGEFHSPGNIRIDGTFKGNITTKGKLIVGKEGVIDGEIICQNAEIEGHVTANIHAGDFLFIKSTAHLIGNVKVDRIAIENGAVFIGHCQMPDTHQTALDV